MSEYHNVVSRDKIQEYINGRPLATTGGAALKKGWEYVQKDWGNAIITGLIFYFIGIIGPWMMSGMFMGLYDEEQGKKKFEMNDLFRGFDNGHSILMYFLILMGLLFAILFGMFIVFGGIGAVIGGEDGFALGFALAYFLFFFVAIILTILHAFSIHLITFSGVSGWESIKLSAGIVKNNIGTVLGFTILSFLINMLGVMLCFVGVIVTVPIIYFASYYLFRDGLEIDTSPDGLDAAIEHLV